MTRISNNKWSALALGLLAMATAGVAVAQQTASERYARALADAAITARYNTQIEQQLRSQEQQIASLEQQIANLDATAVDVQSMLQRMYDELKNRPLFLVQADTHQNAPLPRDPDRPAPEPAAPL